MRGEGFRSNINGLRAWAVVAVVLYHFNVPGFSGVFAWVDVLFVISVFLVPSIVCKGMDAGRFGLAGFYLARARRSCRRRWAQVWSSWPGVRALS